MSSEISSAADATGARARPASVSVIICTRDRAKSLRETLEALVDCAVPDDVAAELIIVDNGSTDRTPEVARRASLGGVQARLLEEPTPGLSRARNAGLDASQADIILFTDDDVRPPAGWIEGMCRPILRGSADAVAGGVHLPAGYERQLTGGQWAARRGWLASSAGVDPANPRTLIGANMAFRRELAIVLGGFDTNLGAGALGFCEETLFAERLLAAGYTICGALENSVAHHFDLSRLTHATLLKMAERMGRSNAYLDYHWGDADTAPAQGMAARACLLLTFERVAKVVHRALGRESWADVQRVQTLAYWRQLATYAGQPRRYTATVANAAAS